MSEIEYSPETTAILKRLDEGDALTKADVIILLLECNVLLKRVEICIDSWAKQLKENREKESKS